MEPDQKFLGNLLELTSALQTEANLHLLGQLTVRTILLNNLIDRIFLEQAVRAHPEILETPVSVVVIAGLARTGTTLLHRLMSGQPTSLFSSSPLLSVNLKLGKNAHLRLSSLPLTSSGPAVPDDPGLGVCLPRAFPGLPSVQLVRPPPCPPWH
jgi:hypothetical protein